eukprot:11223107-Lingulodinium_polyedra.AAC.1
MFRDLQLGPADPEFGLRPLPTPGEFGQASAYFIPRRGLRGRRGPLRALRPRQRRGPSLRG